VKRLLQINVKFLRLAYRIFSFFLPIGGLASSGAVAVVLHAEELDHSGCIFGSSHPAADPAGLGQDVVRLGTTRRDHLVTQLARQRQVGQAVTVDVTHLLSAIPVFGATEAVRDRLDTGPRCDRLPDQLSSAGHTSFPYLQTVAGSALHATQTHMRQARRLGLDSGFIYVPARAPR
jgi:hypothetical protein